MKKFVKKAALATVLAASMASCNDFLTVDPSDKLVQDNFYTSAEHIRLNTMTLYAAKTWTNYTINFQWKTDMLAGDMFYTYDAEGQWFFGTYTPVNQYINEGWKGIYNVILFANSVINDMPKSCKGVAQADIDAAIAEARAIRAFCYYQIAELWHDAPIIFDNTSNIANGNLDVPRNTQKSIYRFALEDADFAVENLPENDPDNWRCNKNTARAIRAKLLVTMASHSDYGYDRADLYRRAAADAEAVMESLPWIENIPFETLFDVESNNGPESLLAVQCAVQGYGYGNAKNAAWSRSSVIADQTWGAGKGPTISLQKAYDSTDRRRKWTYMTNGDFYPNLAKADGGYTYKYISRDAEGTVVEDRNEMNAHIKKYVIGKAADCGGNVGLGQDAANNIYLIRLADMYLTYAEAILGTGNSTSDAKALEKYNGIRKRAGVSEANSITFRDIMQERRREFAFESVTWFDVLRLRYREGDAAALEYVNNGYGSGYNRSAQYIMVSGTDESQENNDDSYIIVQNRAEYAQYDPINLSASAFKVPIPAAVSTSSPALSKEPVDFYEGE